MRKKYSLGMFLFDAVMTLITGGLWILFLIIRYLRTH